ncbi:ABC transporter substrate-binding protein [Virgibacillus profundi]|uniref:ABC transporter substrate-binding protein n=2 Tax=Virgibacillus profundi TaxID=2024555 RepID=A0A2A2IJW0_9BACI|nr:ABC transporter substrate-binding protein [Virgibacillus profundi]PXY55854.1 ABC transporter substrate-binding protein [Virgibacillus profundi]
MPIVEEPIKLNFFAGKAPATADDWNDVLVYNTYEEMTGIDIEWEMVPFESLKEKRNLALASGTLPDAFHTSLFANIDILKYGNQGVFIPLNDLIEEYAPNLQKLFEEYPEVKKALTFPDGNIYSLPTIYSPDFLSLLISERPWVREDWLTELNMEVPETTEDLYSYLKAVKENDPNGNGEADEIPFGGTSINSLLSWLKGSYGIGNRGVGHAFIDMDPEKGEVRFYPTTDEYKEMLQFVNKLYEEKLIEQNIFTIEWDQYLANASESMYGSTVFNSPEQLFAGDAGEKYMPGVALEGPYGDKLFTGISPSVGGMGGFVITNENENPAATVRWMDYFYGDEGSKLFFMGVEGETYEETDDGTVEYVDEITNSPDGLTLDQELAKYVTWPGGGYPGIVKEEFFKGTESSPSSLESAEILKPYLIEEVWPKFTYTLEESDNLSVLSTDIEKYVEETRDKFITGDVPFTEWDNYVETIENMGLEDYMEIQKAAYGRYKGDN